MSSSLWIEIDRRFYICSSRYRDEYLMFNDDIQVFYNWRKKKQNGDDGDIESDSNKLEIPQETVATVLSRLIQGDGDVDDDVVWQISLNSTQGTAATVLSGLYGAMKVQGLGPEALKDQVQDDNGEDDDERKNRQGAAFFLQWIRIVIYII